ncbi:MAG: serine hydrolase [Pseudomonadota bacterium]
MLKRILIGIVLLLLAALAYGYASYGSVARAGSGYAAKNICSGYFLSGFSPEVMKEEALRGASSLLAEVSHDVDSGARQVTTKLYGLFERRAIYTPGIGCTVLPAGEKQAEFSVAPLPDLALSEGVAWPDGRAAPGLRADIDALLGDVFTEEDPERPRNTKAVVVVHKGELIAERYADGVSRDTPLIGWSMAKSVTALLVGILVKDQRLDVGAPADVPQWQATADDPRAEITLDQLLRMSSGLEFQETYSAATDVTRMLSLEPDAAAFAASKPLAGPPDTIWSYSSGTTNIISGIVRRRVGDTVQGAYTFSQERLFRPLGIRTATFEADRSGTFVGSSYLYASARDWARLGQLCLQDGVWDGEELLPEGWIEYVTTPTPTTRGNEYGAQFWLNRNPDDPNRARLFPKLPEDAFYMGGYQGQIVLVIPSEDLVITRFGFTPARNHGIEDLAAEVIAALDGAARTTTAPG